MRHGVLVPGAQRVCQLLRAMTDDPRGLSAAEAVRELGIPRASLFRLLDTLVHEGFALRSDGRYRPGPELLRIGQTKPDSGVLRSLAIPVLQKLAEDSGETAHLPQSVGDFSLILEVCDAPSPLRVASRPGTLLELHCSATGKIFLAGLSTEQLAAWHARRKPTEQTPRTLTSLPALEHEAQAVARRGYALDDEESYAGVRCCAAPVRDGVSRVVGAIGITAAASRFRRADVATVAAQVCAAASELTAASARSNPLKRAAAS